MDLHKRIKKLRQDKEWTQQELADKVGVKQKQISSYETGVSKPSANVLMRIAEVFDVSTDSLLADLERLSASKSIKDIELLEYFQAVDHFKEEDKQAIKKVLDAFVTKNKLEELVTK